MTQPVTTPSPFELASTLEELSGLASQIVRCSDELQTVSQCDSLGNGTSVCHVLLPVALSSAQNCLSTLQFIVSQTSTPPPPPSPFISPAMGPLAHSPSPASIPTELYCSVSPIEVRRGEWSALTGRADSPVVDPRLPRPPIPATQRWPLPPSPVGGCSHNEPSPSSPILSPVTPARRGVSIAELVDEEDSSPGTRGGMNPSSSAPTCVNMSSAHSYPPVFISIVDVTPRFIRRDPSESPCLSRIESLRSPSPSQSPPVSPASSDYHHSPSALRRSKRKRASDPATPEVPEGRVTRGSIKRKAALTENSETGTGSPKRVKTGSP